MLSTQRQNSSFYVSKGQLNGFEMKKKNLKDTCKACKTIVFQC